MEYDVYLNVRQEINYKIIEIVSKNSASFAYPTQTIYVKK
jgi:MscS family membrane protein